MPKPNPLPDCNFYQMLALRPDATASELEKQIQARLSQARRLVSHPEQGVKATRLIQQLRTARQVLLDPKLRLQYDEQLKRSRPTYSRYGEQLKQSRSNPSRYDEQLKQSRLPLASQRQKPWSRVLQTITRVGKRQLKELHDRWQVGTRRCQRQVRSFSLWLGSAVSRLTRKVLF